MLMIEGGQEKVVEGHLTRDPDLNCRWCDTGGHKSILRIAIADGELPVSLSGTK